MKENRALDTHIGKQIKKAREAAGLTQERFSELIGMGAKNLSAIERGVAGTSIVKLKQICEILSISSDMLILDNPVTSDNDETDKLNLLIERLKRLSPRQFEMALDINNKLFEIFMLQGDGGK